MNGKLFLITLFAFPIIGTAQGLNRQSDILQLQDASFREVYYFAPKQEPANGKTLKTKKLPIQNATDSQLDSVYKKNYRMDVPIFYESVQHTGAPGQ